MSFYRHLLQQIESLTDETLLTEFRQVGVLAPVRVALEDFKPGDPPPPQFSRHATSHAAGSAQYTAANAAVAVMLVCSVLREAEESGW